MTSTISRAMARWGQRTRSMRVPRISAVRGSVRTSTYPPLPTKQKASLAPRPLARRLARRLISSESVLATKRSARSTPASLKVSGSVAPPPPP